ncbi:UdgX family uracil-DNA binding protein [Bradyrhizobium sp.]|uniref:UdgX family uracil-DNA binding protein n=1 Tax=Bradyrhizobium sp. TaxID=376 RepID=UPI00403780A0
MHPITLAHETDFDGWRRAARALVLNGVPPSEVTWRVREAGEAADAIALEAPHDTFSVPAKFVELARLAILHRAPNRFALLYRLLWRLCRHHDLLTAPGDSDVAEVLAMADAVQRDIKSMQAGLRFREIGREQKARFVAWFAPAHRIVAAAAPFFASRFADMPWSILTPDACAHWDGHAVTITSGIPETPDPNRLEETWQRHCADIVHSAGLKTRNEPPAPAIEPREPPMTRKPVSRTQAAAEGLTALRAQAADCRDCPLWKNATQTVFGEGPAPARLMLVGEQPGDKEDLAGKPFVGPAGNMLDRALDEAGIDRDKVYVTNAVKHFKFVPRGKIRLHQKPSTPEIRACRQWYERELAAIRPDLVVAMGATAAQCVFGKITPINRNRGRSVTLEDGTEALATVHPSYLLRLPDEESRAREYGRFVGDLRLAAKLLKSSAHAD